MSRNKGFAVPLVIMMGLVVSVIGLTISLKAMSDKNSTESAVQSSNAEALAEAGISRGMAELLREKEILNETSCGDSTQGAIIVVDEDNMSVKFTRDNNIGSLDSLGEYKGARSRIIVEFDINKVPTSNSSDLPGVWASQFTGNGGIYANVMGGGGCDILSNGALGTLPVNSPQMSLPSGNNTPALTQAVGKSLGDDSLPELPPFVMPTENVNRIDSCGRGGVALPRGEDNATWPYVLGVEDCEVTNGGAGRIEIYRDGNITLGGNKLTAQEGITLHVNGDVTLRGTAALGGYGTALIVYGNRVVSQTGTGDFYGFVFVPQGEFRSKGTAKVGGTVWAGKIDLGNNSQGKIFQNTYEDLLNMLPTGVTNPPGSERISPIRSWRSAEVGGF